MLTATQSEINLGHLKFGEPYNFHYTLKNVSDQEITITRLIVGCSACTTAHVTNPIVAPGGTVDVSATFTPGSTGLNSKSIDVAYTSGGKVAPAMKLKFKAIVDG
jgi:hypothetical protein